MAKRRKDMWKLLYNFVENDRSLNMYEVFAFVGDILCKQPSLIQPYSFLEFNNRFQDNFILWLISKFFRNLGECRHPETRKRNTALQESIFTSCLVNRPILFERLVRAYVDAIGQLAVECKAQYIEITAFSSNDLCLKEIDTFFTFPIIRVIPFDVDDRMNVLLSVLLHSLSIGYEVNPMLFSLALQNIFKALKKCGISVKLLCLQYCQKIFENVFNFNMYMQHYYESTIRAFSMISEQLGFWFRYNHIVANDVEAFLDIAHNFLNSHRQFLKHLPDKYTTFQLVFNILRHTRNIPLFCKHVNVALKADDFLDILIEYLLLLLQDKNTVVLRWQVPVPIIPMVERHPQMLRLLGALIVEEDISASTDVLEYFKKTLMEIFASTTVSHYKLKLLKEMMIALVMVEHYELRKKQLNWMKAHHGSLDFEKMSSKESDCNLFAGLLNKKQTKAFGESVANFKLYIEPIGLFEYCTLLYEIFALVLQSTTFCEILPEETQKILIGYILTPIITVYGSGKVTLPEQHELAFAAIQSISTISFPSKKQNIRKFFNKTIENIAGQLFLSSKKKINLSIEMLPAFCDNLDNFFANGLLTQDDILRTISKGFDRTSNVLPELLKGAYCTDNWKSFYSFKWPPYLKHKRNSDVVKMICLECTKMCQSDLISYMEENPVIQIKCPKPRPHPADMTPINLSMSFRQTLESAYLKDDRFSFLSNHLELVRIPVNDCVETISYIADISNLNLKLLHSIVVDFIAKDETFINTIARFILNRTLFSLKNGEWEALQQFELLALIKFCAQSDYLNEQWLFHFFKMTFFFLVHPQSSVVHEAILCVTEICDKRGVQSIQLWNCYKRDALNLIVQLAVYIYLLEGVRLTKSLKAFSKMLGFSCVEEFVCKYYRLLTTMILPYCVKEPRCKGLLVNISKITHKPISKLFVVSFLRIYTHIYLTEEAEIGNRCIDLIVQCTACSLKKLMITDVKQTVSECILYFNRNPKFVMKTFQCLLLYENTQTGNCYSYNTTKTSTSEFAKFIADRFLGVITYFESCLSEPNFEKSLKEEALYSLGQIIRFVGANHVTQFRFKILSMLSFVLSLNDRHLQSICLKIWNIFLNIVNIEELGPSLSRIVASLQPLLQHSEAEVNAIYEFVILKNDSLLGVYLPDLYFMEKMERVAPAIRNFVARQTEILISDDYLLLDKLAFLYKQICNDNLQVRIYGLSYLKQFIANNREAINQLVLREIRLNPLVENIVEILVAGCRHEDINLQLFCAKCLGELGAIDPSYLASNYTFEKACEISFNIHTDEFAIMALTELCRAYQTQKDTKYVDNFSLAIQETLSVCGISPKEKKKMNVWQAIPSRMHQVMEPLLTSCYTGSHRENKCKEHPIFNSIFCRTYEDWAFAWASRLIEFIQVGETKHLLSSYKPSIRRDNNTLALFFPYIVLHALKDCSENQMRQVYEEFEMVFSVRSRRVTLLPEYETSGCKEFQHNKYTAGRNGDMTNVCSYDSLENIGRNCVKLCCEQIEFLLRWEREWQRLNVFAGKSVDSDVEYKRILGFVQKFDKLQISKANFNSGEFARSLMYLEEYILQNKRVHLQEQVSFLIEIYVNLQDADSVEGAVFMKKSKLSLSEEILVNRIVDRPQDAMTCYEQLISRQEVLDQEHIKGMINWYLRMDTPETALLITDGLWQKLTDKYTDDYFKECKSELLWRLGRYDELQELLEDSVVRRKTANWNIQCGEALLLFRDMRSSEESTELNQSFLLQLDTIRSNVLSTMRTCSGVKQNVYSHSYEDVVKLHLLNEVEKNKLLLNHIMTSLREQVTEDKRKQCFEKVCQLFADWDARLCVLQPTVRVMEPILCVRRNLLIETKRLISQCSTVFSNVSASEALISELSTLLDTQIGKLWMRSAQINRDAGSLQQAQLSIMKATEYEPPRLFIEKAKLLWEKGDQTNSFKVIAENLERLQIKCDDDIKLLDANDRSLYAEAKYLQATYSAESMNICSELNIQYFKEAIFCNRNSENYYVQLAQYLEKVYDSTGKEQRQNESGRVLLLEIMVNYARSLRCGCANVYQSLPRLLSIWLDYSSHCSSLLEQPQVNSSDSISRQNSKIGPVQDLVKKMNELISSCSSVLPVSIFYTAYSQLLSRICHPSDEVFDILRSIVIKLIDNYPQQSLWMLLPIYKSSLTNRIKRCKLIFMDKRLARRDFQKLLNDFNMFAERLIELTNKEIDLSEEYELSSLVKQLPKFFEDPNFSQLLLPFEKYMQASFPIASNSFAGGSEGKDVRHALMPTNPFPYKQIYITGINEEVTVLHSAAKPKKITIKCNDGNTYDVMIKPKDDLRKDFRLMEFNGLVKRYLHQDPQARHRRLRIRTYAAIPFNDQCGLIEWLPKLYSFRGICSAIYRTRGLGILDQKLREYALPKTEEIEKKREVFLKVLVAKHPAVFQEWFRQNFFTPQSWYEARSSFVKTTSVMSMVGYILGLGDRHGENMLFDKTNGDAVHVDFSCLFNQGETFPYPELVPFRLTHNLVYAMGPLGVEGMFRKCCEITLRVLQHESKTLMSVLRPFVYDFVAYNRNSNRMLSGFECTDPKALLDVQRIQERLKGYVKRSLANSMPLSIEGQVSYLIDEATDIDNLASMYIGWGAYI